MTTSTLAPFYGDPAPNYPLAASVSSGHRRRSDDNKWQTCCTQRSYVMNTNIRDPLVLSSMYVVPPRPSCGPRLTGSLPSDEWNGIKYGIVCRWRCALLYKFIPSLIIGSGLLALVEEVYLWHLNRWKVMMRWIFLKYFK